ncbi:hypothetical protein LZ31DRAFT_552450 [Colletotrichum somersetense]|nr:hypothetical protein LZ31DRAFT_552450 [Colletotrichum somersetense]
MRTAGTGSEPATLALTLFPLLHAAQFAHPPKQTNTPSLREGNENNPETLRFPQLPQVSVRYLARPSIVSLQTAHY